MRGEEEEEEEEEMEEGEEDLFASRTAVKISDPLSFSAACLQVHM